MQCRMERMKSNSIKHLTKNALQWLLIFLTAIVLAVCMRVFLFALYSIPTPSMEPAIVAGDKVLITKLIPGPRIVRNFFSLHEGADFGSYPPTLARKTSG